jgi:hypothetical protein
MILEFERDLDKIQNLRFLVAVMTPDFWIQGFECPIQNTGRLMTTLVQLSGSSGVRFGQRCEIGET